MTLTRTQYRTAVSAARDEVKDIINSMENLIIDADEELTDPMRHVLDDLYDTLEEYLRLTDSAAKRAMEDF